jgi:AmmeMemoRadiSam system protein A
MTSMLLEEEKKYLLTISRNALVEAVVSRRLVKIEPSQIPESLLEMGATFVTLTHHGYLRGCIGTLEATRPIVEDVIEHTFAAALNDYRFHPVQVGELDSINIEISYLSKPEILVYDEPSSLPSLLRKGMDGVVLQEGMRRATFLPQVWEKIPSPVEFLNQLCLKMGVDSNYWRLNRLVVKTYQVEEFHE